MSLEWDCVGAAVGNETLREVGNGGVVVWMWWFDGEGIAEVFMEGIDEGCCKVVWGEVGLEIPRKDMGNIEGKVVADAV